MNDSAPDLAARIARLEAEVRHLRDLADVQDVITRYSRALDWLDERALDAVFYDDAVIDYGFFRGSGKDFKPVLMQVERAAGRRWHFTSQVKIALQGDIAEVESYNLSVASPDATPGSETQVMHFYGYYQDTIARRGGCWGILRRKHLAIAATALRDVPMQGELASLNKIGYASTEHADFRALASAPPPAR
jgi:hypothetical protein